MSTVVVALVGLAGVLLGHVLTRSGEYRKWLRSERHRCAAELLATCEALRRHSAARILARYRLGRVAPDELDEPASRALDPETHLADVERLELALEAVRTVFPAGVAALADEFSEAARALAWTGVRTEPEAQPGERYQAARANVTDAVRPLIAPSLGSRLTSWRARRGVAAGSRRRPPESMRGAS